MTKARVLVIEDERAIRQGIVDALDFEGFETLEAGDGNEGLELALRGTYDLLLLDLMLPGKDGFQILKELRGSRPTTPVIILTARGSEDDRVKGLRLGADDYVIKPFSVRELLARVGAVLRRSPGRPTDLRTLSFPGGTADLGRGEIVTEGGVRSELSSREAELLRYLAVNAGRPITRDELIANVWQLNPRAINETRTIDIHVARLREKLGEKGASIVRTVRGKGYMYDPGDDPP